MGSAESDTEVVEVAAVTVGNDAVAVAIGTLVGERNEVVASIDMKSAGAEIAAAVAVAVDIASVEGIAVAAMGIGPAVALMDNAAPEYIAFAVVASDTDYDEDVATVLATATATAVAVVAAAGVVD